MIISDLAVKKSSSVILLALLLLLFGVYSYLRLPRENEPPITIPNILVATSYRGVSAADIETSVTREIEKKLKGLEGVKKIESVSSEGLSSIDIEFTADIDIKQALQDVKDKVDEAMSDLPADLEDEPVVSEVNFAEMPIAVYGLSGTCGLRCLRIIADDLKDSIESIPGVLEAEVAGGLDREIRVEILPEKLAYYQLDLAGLEEVLTQENQNISGGTIELGNGRFQLMVPGTFQTPGEIATIIVGNHRGEPVYLKDVAQVIDGFKEEIGKSRINGKPAVTLTVRKRSGENIIRIIKEIDDLIEKIRPAWPAATDITKTIDKSREIELMVKDLENNILTGLILVLIVVFLAMGLRNAIMTSLAIPFSMLLSLTLLHLLGITLNMVVLFGLTMALGMLLDNAIVIIENIYRYMELGVPRKEAAARASAEVASPVICSTLTTLAAFSPLLFWPDIVGEFMSYLPLTLIIALSSSLFVALVLNPAFASLFMKVRNTRAELQLPTLYDAGCAEQPQTRGMLVTRYTNALATALANPLTVIFLAFCLLVMMLQGWLLSIGLYKPVEFFPDIEPASMNVNIEMPEGTTIDYADRIIRRVESVLTEPAADEGEFTESHPALADIQTIYSQAVLGGGDQEEESDFEDNTPSHVGITFIELAERSRSSHLVIEEVRQRIAHIPGADITVGVEKEGPETGEPICIEISGDDFHILGELAMKVRTTLARIPHVTDIKDNYSERHPSIKVVIDRQKASFFGLSTGTIGAALKSGYNGLNVSSYRENNSEYDITVRFPEEDRKVVDILHQLMLPTPAGIVVPLSTIATVRFEGAIGDITRVNHKRVVTVEASVDETMVPSSVVRDQAEELLQTLNLPQGYGIAYTGEFEAEEESEQFLFSAFIAAMLLIFLILVTMFNSFIQPFIIMTSILLSLGGALLGLTLFRQPFGIIMSGVGIISLAGIVVNNGIVLIDYTNRLRHDGMALEQAIITAGSTRLRPVLLTAITTILGLLPMVTGISFDFHAMTISWVSESSQWWRSMAIVVIFGLLVSTFLTLLVVPVLYFLMDRFTSLLHGQREHDTTCIAPSLLTCSQANQESGRN